VLQVQWVPADTPGYSAGTTFVTLAASPALAKELADANERGRLVLTDQRPPLEYRTDPLRRIKRYP
jgi:hypothetical protein